MKYVAKRSAYVGRTRTEFGLAKFSDGRARLVIPHKAGFEPGDRVDLYQREDGLEIRSNNTDGLYWVGKTTPAAKACSMSLPRGMSAYLLKGRIRDIRVEKIDGGWLIPYDQFHG